MMQKLNFIKPIVCAGALLGITAIFATITNANDFTNRFGFTGPEIFPIDSQISLLHSADLDGDGLNDLIVVNNSRSKNQSALQPDWSYQLCKGSERRRQVGIE